MGILMHSIGPSVAVLGYPSEELYLVVKRWLGFLRATAAMEILIAKIHKRILVNLLTVVLPGILQTYRSLRNTKGCQQNDTISGSKWRDLK